MDMNPDSSWGESAAVGGGLGAFAGPASSVFGGILGYMGQQSANESNQEIARENNRFNRENADKQMAFQERMSSTQYQRALADLRAAGLNPAFYLGGGASSPSGAMAVGQYSEMKNPMADVPHALSQAGSQLQEKQKIEMQEAALMSTLLLNAQQGMVYSANASAIEAQEEKTRAEIANLPIIMEGTKAQTRKHLKDIELLGIETRSRAADLPFKEKVGQIKGDSKAIQYMDAYSEPIRNTLGTITDMLPAVIAMKYLKRIPNLFRQMGGTDGQPVPPPVPPKQGYKEFMKRKK